MENTEAKAQEQMEQTEEKTFTQAELNAIVQKRVGDLTAKYENYEELKEKAQKFDDIEEKSKSELQKATEKAEDLQKKLDALTKANSVREVRAKVEKETGVPADLLSGEDEESCTKQAKAILEFAKPHGYPNVKDTGELQKPVGKTGTAEQFAEWFKKSLG